MPKGRFASSGVVVGQTRRDRRDQKTDQLKGNKVTMGKNVPRQTEGAVGDITVREITTVGLRCYIKTNSGWFDMNAMVASFQPKWTPMSLESNWTADATFSEPSYLKDLSGFVHLRGAVDDQDTAVSNVNNDITTLPAGFRPHKTIHRVVIREALAELQQIRINSAGEIDCPYAYTLAAGAGSTGDEVVVNLAKAVCFDGVSFFAGKKATSVTSGQEFEQGDIGHGVVL